MPECKDGAGWFAALNPAMARFEINNAIVPPRSSHRSRTSPATSNG
jgi:hypothetical protein